MKGFIDDIWIFTKYGIPMFYLHGDKKKDICQLSSMLSVISIFLNIMSASEHYSLETSRQKITMQYCHDTQVIAGVVTKKTVKEKQIIPQLNIICSLIEGFFSEKDLSTFNGDISIFEDLEVEIMELRNIRLCQPVMIH